MEPEQPATHPLCFRELFVFDPSRIEAYKSGERRLDSTTIARAAEAGQMAFLQWCHAQGHCIDASALGYACKAGQREVALWMLQARVISWEEADAPYNQELLQAECLAMGIPNELVASIPPLAAWIRDFYAGTPEKAHKEGVYTRGLKEVLEMVTQ